MTDFVIIVVVLAVVGLAAGYVIKAKKNGQKCIGCPHSKSCGSSTACTCGCSGKKDA